MTLHNARNSAVNEQGRQGAVGGCAYICMYIYTDQEKWMLTTLHIYWFTQNMVLKIVEIVEQYFYFYY